MRMTSLPQRSYALCWRRSVTGAVLVFALGSCGRSGSPDVAHVHALELRSQPGDLGLVTTSKPVACTWVLRNRSDEVAVIGELVPSCGCLRIVGVEPRVVPPGALTVVQSELWAHPGALHVIGVMLYVSDGSSAPIWLPARAVGDVALELKFMPRLLSASPASTQSTTSRTVTLCIAGTQLGGREEFTVSLRPLLDGVSCPARVTARPHDSGRAPLPEMHAAFAVEIDPRLESSRRAGEDIAIEAIATDEAGAEWKASLYWRPMHPDRQTDAPLYHYQGVATVDEEYCAEIQIGAALSPTDLEGFAARLPQQVRLMRANSSSGVLALGVTPRASGPFHIEISMEGVGIAREGPAPIMGICLAGVARHVSRQSSSQDEE